MPGLWHEFLYVYEALPVPIVAPIDFAPGVLRETENYLGARTSTSRLPKAFKFRIFRVISNPFKDIVVFAPELR